MGQQVRDSLKKQASMFRPDLAWLNYIF
jgi:hypothetical protein